MCKITVYLEGIKKPSIMYIDGSTKTWKTFFLDRDAEIFSVLDSRNDKYTIFPAKKIIKVEIEKS